MSPLRLPLKAVDQPRAVGAGFVVMCSDALGKTRLKDLRNSGSTKLVFPQSTARNCEVILVNTAGGITGGDRFNLDVCVQAAGDLTLTTQAAERAYRAQPGEVGQLTSRLTVQAGATLKWLPQEMILFDRCALQRRLEVDLAPTAQFLMVEPLVFGRAAMGEKLNDVKFSDRIKISRDGQPIYVDGIELNGDVTRHLERPAIANGAGAMASVVMVGCDMAQHLTPVRAILPDSAGASIIADDILVVRLLGADSFELRRSLIPVLEHLSQTPLPKSWNL
jgi:urease accessory protein